jgi:hypothetical protein
MIILRNQAMRRWTVEVSEDVAIFSGAPQVEDHTAARGLPRVWPGRGLGLPESELQGFTAALAEVMKTHAYWHARSRRPAGSSEADGWSVPRRDDDDGFVYITGPAGQRNGNAGYSPASVFSLDLAGIRGLRIRLTAYLKNRRAAEHGRQLS